MTEYQDYKYVMQDTGNLYLGAKYTYDELMANEDVPFKFKTFIERYIRPKLDMDTTLESHFYHMDEEGFLYQAFRQLKVKIKFNILTEKKTLSGKRRSAYRTEVMKLEKFAALTPAQKEEMGVMIQEIGMSKLALMTFSI